MYVRIDSHSTPTTETVEIWRQSGPRDTIYLLHRLVGQSSDVRKVLALDFVADKTGAYSFCYVLPLVSGQYEAHLEYCRQAAEEGREATTRACLAFGMLTLHKWIQRLDGKDYVLYYQEMREPIAACREKFLRLADDLTALQATKTLREQTGLAFSDLFPLSEQLYSRP